MLSINVGCVYLYARSIRATISVGNPCFLSECFALPPRDRYKPEDPILDKELRWRSTLRNRVFSRFSRACRKNPVSASAYICRGGAPVPAPIGSIEGQLLTVSKCEATARLPTDPRFGRLRIGFAAQRFLLETRQPCQSGKHPVPPNGFASW